MSAPADGGFKTSHRAVGIDRKDAAKPIKQVGEAVAHVQAACPRGVRPKAIAVDSVRLLNSPSVGKDFFHPPSFLP